MSMMNTVRAQFTATAAGFRSTIQSIVNDTKRIGKASTESTNVANKGFSSMGSTIAKVGGAYIAFQGLTTGLGALGHATIGANADMETYQNTLTTLMGSQEEAVKTMDWAVKFAAQTPFEIPEIVDATAKLTAYGINAEDVMTNIGNMAAIMGKPLDQAVEAVADAQTGELERLKEFGITKQMLIDKAQEMYGVEIVNAKGQITDMEKMNGALMGIMEERYAGGMDIASKSFRGLVSNAKDSMATIMREMSKPIFDKFKQGLQAVTPILAALVSMIKGDVKSASDILTQAFGTEKAGQIMAFFNNIRDGGLAVVAWIKSFAPTVTNLGTIFQNLAPIASMAFNGIKLAFAGLALAIPPIVNGITSVVAAFTSWSGFVPVVTGLVTAFITFKGILTGVSVATKAYTAVVTALSVAKRTLRAVTLAYTIAGGGARGVMLAMRAAALQLNLALLANPIVLIIALIAGLVAGIIIAYKHSETFRNIVNGVWEAIKTAFGAALEWLTNFFTVSIPNAWNSAMSWFSGVWTWLVAFFTKWGTTILAILVPFLGIPLLIYQKWDTIKAFLAGVWEAAKAMVMPIITGFINGIVNAFNASVAFIVNAWNSLKAGVVAIWNAVVAVVMPIVTGFITNLKTWFSNFVTNLMTIINPIKDFFVNTWNNIKLLVLGIIGVFINLLLGRFDDVKLSLKAIWTAIQRQITDTVNAIKQVALAVFKLMVSSVKNIFNGLKTAASTIWNSMKSTASSVWAGLKMAVLNIVNALKISSINAFNSLKTGAIAAWNSLKSSVISLANSIKTGAINAWNSLKSGVVNAANALKTGAMAAWNSLKSSITSAVNSIKTTTTSGFNGAKTAAVNAFNSMKSSVSSAISNIKTYVSGMKTSIISTIKGINLRQIGSDIINGLYNGIAGGAKKVLNKAKEIADGITSKIKKALSIHSPSRVMAEMGEYTGEGLVVGMDNMRKKVGNMAGKLASAMKAPVTGSVIGKVGSAVVQSVHQIAHSIDLKNIPSHINESMLVDLLSKSIGNPKLQKAIDRINYKNNNGAKLPQGR